MASKWFEKKDIALKLRRQGKSIRYVEERLGIPRSTLSGWFQEIKLTPRQKKILLNKKQQGLIKARKKAADWHRNEKAKRTKFASKEAKRVIQKINPNDKNLLDLALAMLYLGEGRKSSETSMGNSDPLILEVFISILRKNYKIDIEKIRCDLQIRADQNPDEIKKYWAKTLKLPLKNFKLVRIDKRTIGSKTYPGYKGVCNVRCGNVAIQRKLLSISKEFCQKIVKERV